MAKSVIVNGDVEVYDVPGGGGQVVGELDGGEGQRVGLYKCRPDNWCEVGFAGGLQPLRGQVRPIDGNKPGWDAVVNFDS